jgi:predicted esterase
MMPAVQLFSAIWALFAGSLSVLLLFVALTWEGRLFAVTAILVSVTPLVASFGREVKRRKRRPLVLTMAVAAILFYAVLLARAPSGAARPSSKVRHIYADGETHFRRFALGNLLPEIDQITLGFSLVPFVDPLFTQRQASGLKQFTAELYRDLERDPDFRALGSVMPEVYADLRGSRFETGHVFLYVPATRDPSQPRPALVFLHGSGGNFKAYLWLLSQLAERLNVVVIAPSYGMGNWNGTDTAAIVKAAIAMSSNHVKIDANNVHVMGLSNGGLGVTQLLQPNGTPFRSFVFLSPVFDTVRISEMRNPSLANLPIFVLTGSLDDRVPLDYVEATARSLTARGGAVTLERLSDANHFAFFSHREKVLSALENWLRGHGL